MSNYNQTTFFTAKDSLTTGDAAKVIRGSEIDPELSAISTAITTKIDTAGAGMTKASTTLALDISGLTAATAVGADSFGFVDASDTNAMKRITLTNLVPIIQGLLTTTVTGTSGLTGGGAISSNQTISLDATSTRNTDHAAVSVSAGTGLTGGGTIAATRTISLDTSNTRNVDHAAVSISPGNGVTGGGTLAATRTITLGTGGSVTATSTNAVTASSHTHAIGAGIARFSTATGGSITVSTSAPSGTPATNDIWIQREA